MKFEIENNNYNNRARIYCIHKSNIIYKHSQKKNQNKTNEFINLKKKKEEKWCMQSYSTINAHTFKRKMLVSLVRQGPNLIG